MANDAESGTTDDLSHVVHDALDPVRAMLESDGYGLEVAVDGESVQVAIVPTADACGECLVPRAVLQSMIGECISERGVDAQVTVRYPAEHVDR